MEGGREGGREGRREGGREGEREGGREGERVRGCKTPGANSLLLFLVTQNIPRVLGCEGRHLTSQRLRNGAEMSVGSPAGINRVGTGGTPLPAAGKNEKHLQSVLRNVTHSAFISREKSFANFAGLLLRVKIIREYCIAYKVWLSTKMQTTKFLFAK